MALGVRNDGSQSGGVMTLGVESSGGVVACLFWSLQRSGNKEVGRRRVVVTPEERGGDRAFRRRWGWLRGGGGRRRSEAGERSGVEFQWADQCPGLDTRCIGFLMDQGKVLLYCNR